MNYIYELKMKVRDYECDLQGIVNNANYQHYLEHTRHEFLYLDIADKVAQPPYITQDIHLQIRLASFLRLRPNSK